MSAPAQPSIDALEAAVTTLQGKLTASEAENETLKQEIAAGVLTDAQATKMKTLQELAAGLGK